MFYATIKFTAENSKDERNFLDNWKLTDLFVKTTDTHQFLDPTSCHPHHCKKGIRHSQALRLTEFVQITRTLIDSFKEMGNEKRL